MGADDLPVSAFLSVSKRFHGLVVPGILRKEAKLETHEL